MKEHIFQNVQKFLCSGQKKRLFLKLAHQVYYEICGR